MLVAAYIVIALIILVAVFLYLPISSIATAMFKEDNISLKIEVKLARIITLFGWDSGEEGLSFLVKKTDQVKNEKKKKNRLNAVIDRIFNPRSILHLKGMSVAAFEASGIIATEDAARTALVYGLLCGVVSAVIPFLNSRKIKVDFYPDFQKKKPDFHISCIIRVRIIHIIYLLKEYYRDKREKKGGSVYGTASY